MSEAAVLVSLQSAAQSGAARALIAEYLHWVAGIAHALYRSVGFAEIDPYDENSMRDYQASETLAAYCCSAVFMERTLPVA